MTTYHDDPSTSKLFEDVLNEFRAMSPQEFVELLNNAEPGPIAALLEASEYTRDFADVAAFLETEGLGAVAWDASAGNADLSVSYDVVGTALELSACTGLDDSCVWVPESSVRLAQVATSGGMRNPDSRVETCNTLAEAA